MTHTSYPFDSQETTETQYSKLFRELQDSGVVGSHGGPELQVFASGGGMFVSIRPGDAFVRGHYYTQSTQEDVPIAAAEPSTRYDIIVLRLNPTANTITPDVIKGDYTTGLEPPLIQSDVDNFELPIGVVTVAPGVANISVAAVEDRRSFVGSRVNAWSFGTRPSGRKASLGLNVDTGLWEYFDGMGWTPLAPTVIDPIAPIFGDLGSYNPAKPIHEASGYTEKVSGPDGKTTINLPSGVTAVLAPVEVFPAIRGLANQRTHITFLPDQSSLAGLRFDFANVASGTAMVNTWVAFGYRIRYQK